MAASNKSRFSKAITRLCVVRYRFPSFSLGLTLYVHTPERVCVFDGCVQWTGSTDVRYVCVNLCVYSGLCVMSMKEGRGSLCSSAS